MTKSGYPSDQEIEQAADIIERLPRGYLPYSLFIAITAKIVTPTLELAIFRMSPSRLEILLTKRPDDDMYWPGQWHVPGTVIRSDDFERTYDSCFARIQNDELNGLVRFSAPKRTSIEFWDVERGRELDQLFYAELEGSNTLPENIKFFSVDELPVNLMRHHNEVIGNIVKVYRRQNKVS